MAEATVNDMPIEGAKTTTVVTVEGGGPLSTVRRIASDPSVRRSMPAILGVILTVIGLASFYFLNKPPLTTLYAGMPEAEKARVVEALMNTGMQVQLDPTTGEILVPTSDYHTARMQLAAQGLPASVPEGYDSISDIPMGSSRTVENVRLKQSQEIELARSISEIQGLVAARVHLAIPEKSVFARASVSASASIFVQMEDGRALSRQQVSAIVHLVSSSVPSMPKSEVTVVDQYGNLLSQPGQTAASAASDTQLEHRIRLEDIYRQRIISIVTPMVGGGNVMAEVNLGIDFTRSEITEELVDPDRNALRSEQRSSDTSSEKTARGIPGATANMAPAETEVTTQQGDAQGGGGVSNRSSSEVRNYEVSRTVSTTRKPGTEITRIQASVLVRDMEVINPETGLPEIRPVSPETLADIERLVINAIGIDEERGDNVTVSSAAFVATLKGVTKPWYDMEWAVTLMKQGMTILIMAVVVLGVIRPLISRIMVPAAAGAPGEAMVSLDDDDEVEQVEIQEGESLEEIKAKLKPKKAAISAEMLDTANTYDDKVAVIRMIVGEEAGRVSNVFKTMIQRDLG
ncbi:flagellar basal-body MS-ring/collar protein FliF [Alphaproteobacteria bacterium]|nr:flagellar basal-body MS-ring/collar protein FliF [Alphaproteobacteria bacterium]